MKKLFFIVTMTLALTSLASARSSLAPSFIGAGIEHTCAIGNAGLRCWGDNKVGEINIPKLHDPTQVSAGDLHTCAIDDSGLHCWGYNADGQTDVPAELHNPTQVSAGIMHTCAIDDSGLHCWGNNFFDQTDVPELHHPTQVSAGARHTCAIDDSGLHCWGYNGYGQTKVPELHHPIQVSAGSNHTCAIDDSGLHCWGYNDAGQTNVPALHHPTQVRAGYNHTCAIDDSGLHCWGDNQRGQTNVPKGFSFDSYFTGTNLKHFTLDLSKYVYLDRAELLKKIGALDPSLPNGFSLNGMSIAQLRPLLTKIETLSFLGNSLSSFLEQMHSKKFDELIIPSFKENLAKLNAQAQTVRGLADLSNSDPDLLKLSYSLQASALQAVKGSLASTQDQATAQKLLQVLGVAIAQPLNGRADVIAAYANPAAQALLDRLNAQATTRPFGAFLRTQLEWMK
jgi:hypothetical protein